MALRSPSRATGRHPRPASARRGGRRSHSVSAHRQAGEQGGARAEKRAAFRPIHSVSPAPARAAPAPASRDRPARLHAAARARLPWMATLDRRRAVPASRLRSDTRASVRSVHQIQTSAAITPPAAPAASDAGDMQRQRGGADGVDPPGAQAGHHQLRVADRARDAERAADERQHQRLRSRTTGAPPRRKPTALQQADFAHALLDAELEEQRGQQQSRDDQEEAEVDEILAEVGGAARRGEPFGAHVAHGQARRERIDRGAQPRRRTARAPRRAAARRRREPNGGQRAVARLPERLADVERDERLRRRAVAVPVLPRRPGGCGADRSERADPSRGDSPNP